MSNKCRAYSTSKLGLEPPDNKRAFYAGWDAAMQLQKQYTKIENAKIMRIAKLMAVHIDNPLTLDEILDKIVSGDYNRESVIQHVFANIKAKNE